MRFYPANARTVFARQALAARIDFTADTGDLLPYHRGPAEADTPPLPTDSLSAYPLPTGLTERPDPTDEMMAT